MKYYLITTSDVRSWKFDRKVLFLGEWCINNEKKKHLINLDYKIMPPIEIDENTRKKNLLKIEKYICVLMPLISKSLNDHHNVKYSERYWTILIGHWLHRLISTIFNRYQTLEKAFKDFKLSGTTILKFEDSFLATKDTLDLYMLQMIKYGIICYMV